MNLTRRLNRIEQRAWKKAGECVHCGGSRVPPKVIILPSPEEDEEDADNLNASCRWCGRPTLVVLTKEKPP